VTAAFPLSVAASWRRLVAVFVVAVVCVFTGAAVGARSGWWVGVTLAGLIIVAALLRWRGAALFDLAWASLTGRTNTIDGQAGTLADYRRTFGRPDGVGVRGIGSDLVAMVAVDGPPHSPSVLDFGRVESLVKLPLATVARGLRQCDVRLDGIDILSAGSRRAPQSHHPYSPVYSSEVGDHSAVGQRRTYLVVRFNAVRGAAAVLWRESVAATVTAAAEWLAAELTSMRIPARALTAEQIRDADMLLLAGIDPSTVQPGWGRLRHSGGYVHTYWVSPGDISSAILDRLWAPDTDATVVSVQLRLTDSGATTIGVTVRYHTGAPLAAPPLTGLNPLSGRHDAGLLAGLAQPRPAPAVPCRELRAGEAIAAPVGTTGIIVGSTTTGHPLLVDLADPTASSLVTVCGEFALTVQVALRAAATGYQVLVCSQHPQRWREATAAGLQVVGPRGLGPMLPPSRLPWLVVYDGVDAQVPPTAAVTLRRVGPGSGSTADVHIEQDSPSTAVIRTWAFQYRLRIDLDYERRLVATKSRHAA
jgi:type VII secretion protein EccE